ncbi:MAG: hypothetical protein AAGA60_29575, partial [Cyanobacteria bacterium P01_E01_bin.42]
MKSNQPNGNISQKEKFLFENCLTFFQENWKSLFGVVLTLSGCTILLSWYQSRSRTTLYHRDITVSVQWDFVALPRVTHSSKLIIPSLSWKVDEIYNIILSNFRKRLPKEIGFVYTFN